MAATPAKRTAPLTIGTHSGTFHCDEALGCYLLKRTAEFKDATIVRSRDPAVLETADVVLDVGGVYDAASRRYVDFPITDVLQMMGRAGRPQYDKHGVAVVMVAEPKKAFYKRFLYEPFPVESSLREQVGFLGGGAWVWVAAGGWERSAVVCVVAWWCGVRAPGALSRC